MATANLCKCNKCGTILIDENPQIEADEFELRGDEEYMIWDKDVEDNDDVHWVCPNCYTDGYLMDLSIGDDF